MNLKTNPEFLPLVEWWEKDGKQIVLTLVVFLAAFGAWKYWQMHQAQVKAAASDALVASFTTDELEASVAKYGDKAAGGALKIRLAKSYFDGGRYEEALAQYEALDGKAPDGFAEIPVVGKAQCLEALGKYDEAQKAFEAFAEANPKSPFALTARLGAARCLCQAGDKAKALSCLEALKAANQDDELAKMRIEATESLVKRYVKKAAAVAAPAAETPAKAS